MRVQKEYTVKVVRCRYYGDDTVSTFTGTLDHLVNDVFGYTLECGKSWEHELGNKKVNTHPKTINSLINALNIAESNKSRNGTPGRYYSIVED